MSYNETPSPIPSTAVRVEASDGAFDATFVAPQIPTKRALIVLQEIFGVTQKIRRYCEMFAHDGYAALAPDLFWRLEPRVELGYSEEDIQKAVSLLARFDEDRAIEDVEACSRFLRRRGYTQIGVIGFCLGGKLAPVSLARGAGDAAVTFYGVGLENDRDLLLQIDRPMQLHYGEKDAHVSIQALAILDATAKEHPDMEFYSYPEGGHAFFRPDLKNEESRVAYDRVLKFLDRVLLE